MSQETTLTLLLACGFIVFCLVTWLDKKHEDWLFNPVVFYPLLSSLIFIMCAVAFVGFS